MSRCRRWEGQDGQALVVVLITVSLLGLIGTVLTALWARGVILAQRRAEGAAALYAAEAGIARGFQELVIAGGGSPLTWEGTVGTAPFDATFVGRATASGDGTYELTSTGMKGKTRRTVRVRVATPFLHPLYARANLRINVASEPKSQVRFSPAAAYGSNDPKITPPHSDIEPEPIHQSWQVPDIPFGPFAAAAGPMPSQRVPLSESGGTVTAGWYEADGNCGELPKATERAITVPPGVAAGIAGDLNCGDGKIVIQNGATLVVTGYLHIDRVQLEDGARLVVGGKVQVKSVEVLGNQPGNGGALVVAGGSVDVDGIGGVAHAPATHPLIILALNRGDCAEPACGSDDSNNITIKDVAVRDLVVYAEPLPGQSPAVHLGFDVKEQGGSMHVRGTAVSAGDLELKVHKGTLWFQADPTLLGRFMSLVPEAGVWTQLEWDEIAS